MKHRDVVAVAASPVGLFFQQVARHLDGCRPAGGEFGIAAAPAVDAAQRVLGHTAGRSYGMTVFKRG
jgi:hypothetical protein